MAGEIERYYSGVVKIVMQIHFVVDNLGIWLGSPEPSGLGQSPAG